MNFNRWHKALALSAVCLLGVSAFQNCSNVNFSPAVDQSSLAEASIPTDTPIEVKTSEVKVSARNVPPLKLFFIVDNSYTMQKNQLNLAQSFQTMFATTGGKSLESFATTAYLINTAQKSPAWNSVDLNGLVATQKSPAQISALNIGQLSTLRSAASNSGMVPGDNIGFRLSANANSVSFMPAPVLGLMDDGQGRIAAMEAMTKPAGTNADAFAAEFQKRLSLLNSSRIPLNADGTQQYNSILDSESGLCAMARILRNNSGLIENGDQAAFVIVSDEDDSDRLGASCVQSYLNSTLNDDLIKGRCEERASILSYSVPTVGVGTCKITYNLNYKYTYNWTQQTPKTTIVYRKLISSGTYTVPQTRVSYQVENKTYSATSTEINYFTKSSVPIIADGVVVGQNVNYSPKKASVKGDVTANCTASALALNSAAVVNESGYPVVCNKIVTTVSSCAMGDSACATTSTFVSKTTTLDGDFASGAACLSQASKIAGAIVDGSKPVTCTPSAARTGSGACSTALIALGCAVASAPTYSSATVTVTGDFTTSATSCNSKASAQASAAVDANNPAVCTLNLVSEPKSYSNTLAFSSTVDGGTTLPLGDCQGLKTAIFNAVKAANSLADPAGTCALTGYTSTSTSPAVTAAGCAAQSTAYCDGSAQKFRNCTGQLIAGSVGSSTVDLPVLTSDINCSDLCSAHGGQLCAANQGVAVSATMTIEDYMKARYGAGTTCSVKKSANTVSTFVDRKLSDKNSICSGVPAKPQYLVQEGSPYRLQELVTEHVAGSLKVGVGNYSPSSDLTSYIDSRTKQLFGSSKPILSVFVRTAADGLGQGGSVGVTYENLASVLGGKVERVTSPDYSTAFVQLGDVLQKRLERSFIVAGMTATQKVVAVEHRRAGQNDWVKLKPNQWSASGLSVTLDPLVPMNLEDDIRFTYY